MENIGFNITEYDIREYLKKHKNDVAIKYKEAMFVKYMREHQEITQESLEILMEKYNWQDSVVNGIYYRDSNGILKSEALSDFNSYLDGITNLDISGICYIMVPVLSYYSDYKYHIYMAANLLAEDGSVGIRVTNEDFSKRLCQQFRKAIVSTSANISGQPSPKNFSEISEEVKSAVDYIVGYRQEEISNPKPSSIIKLDKGGVIKIIRE